MTMTTLSDPFVVRIATMLFLADHPMRDWILYPTQSKERQQVRYKQRAKSLISTIINEYNAVEVRKDSALREAVLSFFADAKRFEEDPDGDINSNGGTIDLTTYHITVSHETLRDLVEALGIKVEPFGRESPFEALSQELTND